MADQAGRLAREPYAAVAETHSAVVFFAGDLAYKLKKPVNLGFLDFTGRDARSAACVRETELNRRYAPDVYLGVAEVRDPGGRLCDHLVVMRRMPAGRQLSALVRAGAQVSQDERVTPAARAAMSLGPATGFPLGGSGNVRGVLTVGRRPGSMPLAPAAAEMVESSAAQAGITLELAETRRRAGHRAAGPRAHRP
jgi:hypothetical protein